MDENGTKKPMKIGFQRGRGTRNNRGGKHNPSTSYVCLELSQQNPFVQLIYANKDFFNGQ
jgi:hypothetical protein